MKPTSSISLLLFLQLTTASPIPHKHITTPLPEECLHYASCRPSLKAILSSWTSSSANKHSSPSLPAPAQRSPASKLSNPHFPEHQLSHSQHAPISGLKTTLETGEEETFDNSAQTPPVSLPPGRALDANVPLSSIYLLNLPLNNPNSQQNRQGKLIVQGRTMGVLPSKPTSALGDLRKEDSKRYWENKAHENVDAETRQSVEEKIVGSFSEGRVPAREQGGESLRMEMTKCSNGHLQVDGDREGMLSYSMAREYGDLLVVEIVVLFILAVIIAELSEKFRNSARNIFSRNRHQGKGRRGQIYLSDDELAFDHYEKPFVLQPAPRGYKIAERFGRDEKSRESDRGVEHESDTLEQV